MKWKLVSVLLLLSFSVLFPASSDWAAVYGKMNNSIDFRPVSAPSPAPAAPLNLSIASNDELSNLNVETANGQSLSCSYSVPGKTEEGSPTPMQGSYSNFCVSGYPCINATAPFNPGETREYYLLVRRPGYPIRFDESSLCGNGQRYRYIVRFAYSEREYEYPTDMRALSFESNVPLLGVCGDLSSDAEGKASADANWRQQTPFAIISHEHFNSERNPNYKNILRLTIKNTGASPYFIGIIDAFGNATKLIAANASSCLAPRLQIYLKPEQFDLGPLLADTGAAAPAATDGTYYYFRSPHQPLGVIAIYPTPSQVMVETDYADPANLVRDLAWMSDAGILKNVSRAQILAIGQQTSRYFTRSDYNSDPNGWSANMNGFLVAYRAPLSLKDDAAWPQKGRVLSLYSLPRPGIVSPAPAPSPKTPATPPAQPPTLPSPGPKAGEQPIQPVKPSTPLTQPPLTGPPVPSPPPSGGGSRGPDYGQANEGAGRSAAANGTSGSPYGTVGIAQPMPSTPFSLPEIGGWPWWMAPVIVGALGALFMAVMAFYFQPRALSPTAPVLMQEQIVLSETRLQLLQELEGAERIPTDLASKLGKSKSTIVEHLEGLCNEGLVERVATPGRKFVFYRLSQPGRVLLLRRKQAQ